MELELEQMRQQMNILKAKLDKQDIVNDHLIRRSMKKNVVDINRRYLVISIVCLAMIPYGYWAFVVLNGMSLGFWAATSILMLIVFAYTVYNGRYLRNDSLLEDNLLDAGKKVARAKKLDSDWLKIGIPLGLLWLTYFCYEAYHLYDAAQGKVFVTVGIISGLIGAAIGLKIHFKTQQNYQDLLDQIEDVTD